MTTTIFHRGVKAVALFAVLLSLVACSKDQQGLAGRGSGNGGTPLGPSGGGSVTCNGGSTQQSLGRVYDNTGVSNFEQSVKALLSASANPAAFGTISGLANDDQTGVTIEGSLSFDSSGNIQVAQSNLTLKVYDSFVGQKDPSDNTTIEAYPITFPSAATGSVDRNAKTFSVQFKDGYGEVNLSGRYDNNTATGTITFKNYRSFDGSNTGASGSLGVFSIATCAFIK